MKQYSAHATIPRPDAFAMLLGSAACIALAVSCAGQEPESIGSVSTPTVIGGSCSGTYCSDEYDSSGFCPAECSSFECNCCGWNPDPSCNGEGGGGGDGGGGGGGGGSCSVLPGSIQVSLYYEGSCNFLSQCSAPTRACLDNHTCQPGQVLWGYCGVGSCSMYSEVHVAAPAGHFCGRAVEICRTDNPCICTGGVIVDRSDRNVWEAGPGVFDALGQAHSGDGCTGGFGNLSVFIKTLN